MLKLSNSANHSGQHFLKKYEGKYKFQIQISNPEWCLLVYSTARTVRWGRGMDGERSLPGTTGRYKETVVSSANSIYLNKYKETMDFFS